MKPSAPSEPSPAAVAGAQPSTLSAPPRSLSAAAASRSGSASSSAATRRSARVSASRSPSLAAKARSRRAVSGNASNPDVGSSLSPLATIGSSVRASGFPAAASRTRTLRSSGSSAARASRSARAAASSNLPIGSSASPASSTSFGTPSRTARRRSAGSISRRRATNARTLAEEPIEPLGIVDREQNRSLRRQLRDQPESGKTDQEDVRNATDESPAQRPSPAHRAAARAVESEDRAMEAGADAIRRTGAEPQTPHRSR